jgi:hypothetical protein
MSTSYQDLLQPLPIPNTGYIEYVYCKLCKKQVKKRNYKQHESTLTHQEELYELKRELQQDIYNNDS